MLTLFSYPDLFGVADNNPFGLKVFAFLKLSGLVFRHEHVFDTSQAPRGQLPYLRDGEKVIGDSDRIIAYLTSTYGLSIDAGLTQQQSNMNVLIRRLLDDLYWTMSYSRWKDENFWPQFRDALLRTHPDVTLENMESARAYNFQRYYYQGIGRYEPGPVYARGIESLTVLADLLPEEGFMFGDQPRSVDAAIYGFIANIYYYAIETPLKMLVLSKPKLAAHCRSIHAMIADKS